MKHFITCFLLGTLMFFSTTSCSVPDIEDRPGAVVPDPEPDPTPDPEVAMGHATLRTDWGATSVPAGLRFYFYPTSGAVLIKECPTSGFDGDLKADTYRVLAVNTDPVNVIFKNMESYATATATMNTQAQPCMAYAFSLNPLTVTKGDTQSKQIAVRALTKSITLSFTFPDITKVKSLSGALQGVCASVLLATGESTAEAITAAPSTTVSFAATPSGSRVTASVSVLGLLNPNGGTAYSNVLKMTLTTTTEKVIPIECDLTQLLTQAFANNGGILPEAIELTVPQITTPSTPSIEGDATVPGWGDSGNKDTEL